MNDENRRFTDKFALRLPDGMRNRIASAAEASNRSMNAEIVARLEASFRDAEGGGSGWLDKAQASPRMQAEKRLLKLELDVERMQEELAGLKGKVVP